MRGFYKANLAVMDIGDTFTTGLTKAAYVINELVKPVSVIGSHANEAATKGGKVLPGTRTETFQKAVKTPIHIPLTSRTIEINGGRTCFVSCKNIQHSTNAPVSCATGPSVYVMQCSPPGRCLTSFAMTARRRVNGQNAEPQRLTRMSIFVRFPCSPMNLRAIARRQKNRRLKCGGVNRDTDRRSSSRRVPIPRRTHAGHRSYGAKTPGYFIIRQNREWILRDPMRPH